MRSSSQCAYRSRALAPLRISYWTLFSYCSVLPRSSTVSSSNSVFKESMTRSMLHSADAHMHCFHRSTCWGWYRAEAEGRCWQRRAPLLSNFAGIFICYSYNFIYIFIICPSSCNVPSSSTLGSITEWWCFAHKL